MQAAVGSYALKTTHNFVLRWKNFYLHKKKPINKILCLTPTAAICYTKTKLWHQGTLLVKRRAPTHLNNKPGRLYLTTLASLVTSLPIFLACALLQTRKNDTSVPVNHW